MIKFVFVINLLLFVPSSEAQFLHYNDPTNALSQSPQIVVTSAPRTIQTVRIDPPAPAPVVSVEPVHYPLYKYSYGVSDPVTKDFKTASESRNGDVVEGHYSVQDPDGFLRIVTYTADANGFRAVVTRQASPGAESGVVVETPAAVVPVPATVAG